MLGDIKRITDQHMTAMNNTLKRIEHFLERGQEAFVGNFQSGGPVSRTGLGRVHAGEYVLPARMAAQSSGSTGPLDHSYAHYGTCVGP